MRRTAYSVIASLLVVGALAIPGKAQQINDRVEYDAYVAVINEKDLLKKSALAEKFLVDYKESAAKKETYWILILSYAEIPNWAKAMELAEKLPALAPGFDAAQKNQVLLIGMNAAMQLRNTPRIIEWSEKVLAANPNQIDALRNLSYLWSTSLPTEEAAKQAQMAKVLEINKRALAQPKPAGVTDATWTPIQVHLHRTSCMMLLNQKKNAEAIVECQEALKLNKKDGDSYHLIGLAMISDLNDKLKKYRSSVDKLNENRTADQVTRDELTAEKEGAFEAATKKKDEVVLTFAKAVVAGGGYAAQARTKLQEYASAPGELDKALAEAKADLG
jgi:tetratricopeptide (TPR) repeat protein